MDRKMMEEWRVFFRKAAKATQDPKAELKAGEEQCKYCPAAGRCPAAQEMTMALARKEDWPDIVESIDEEKFRLILEKADFIRSLLAAAEEVAIERLVRGSGIQAGRIKKHRRWIDVECLGRSRRCSERKRSPPQKLITPAQAERLQGCQP
jgi:hypothetical protein